MSRTSAGLLPYRWSGSELQVFVAHMGGPFWARRDERAWSIPKGEYDPAGEDPVDAARREFAEEIGVAAPDGPWLDLGEVRQRGGKTVRAFAVAADGPLEFVSSSTFELEWPPRSGRVQVFPEVDRAEWLTLSRARGALVAAQAVFLERLEESLAR